MHIGLYFGSFNPVHVGHLIIANYVLNNTNIDKLWFVVSPQNPHKSSHTLLNEYDRLHLLSIATKNDTRIKVSNIEFSLPKPSYTYITLAHLKEQYPNNVFSIIMGSDSYKNLPNWKNYEYIYKNYKIFIYQRPEFLIPNLELKENIQLLNAPLLDISATAIRKLIDKNESYRYLVPESVYEEIEKSNHYKNKKGISSKE